MSNDPQPNNTFSPDFLSKAANNIYKPMLELNKSGGLILVWIFIGTLLLIGALSAALTSSEHIIAYLVGGVGTLIILVALCLSVVALKNADAAIKKSEEYRKVVEGIASEMTTLAFQLQSVAFKYEEELGQLLPEAYQLGLPLPRMMIPSSEPSHVIEAELKFRQHVQKFRQQLEELNRRYEQALSQSVDEFSKTSPPLPESLKENTRELSDSIAHLTKEAGKTIKEVKDALISSDPTSLKKPLNDLEELNTKMTRLLGSAKRNSTWGRFSEESII